MKLERRYFCITDKHNKPDYRFLFENKEDAIKKIKRIKNSIQGETLFLSKKKRDFFVDGIKLEHIDHGKKVLIRKGCWTSLKVQEVSFADNIDPTRFFEKVEKSETSKFTYHKEREELNNKIKNTEKKKPVRATVRSFTGFDWQNSFLKTKAFLVSFTILCISTIGTVIFIQQNTHNKIANNLIAAQTKQIKKSAENQTKVLGAKDEASLPQFENELDRFVLEALKDFDDIKENELENEVIAIIKGTPMEKMAPLIAKKERIVAAFLVGIAKKESNFGKRKPVLNGEDCYNYWGYRGIRPRMGSGGHTCFDNIEDAISTVGKRIENLVASGIDTPQEMVLWKCGSRCDGSAIREGHSTANVRKWINDVSINFNKLNIEKENEEDV